VIQSVCFMPYYKSYKKKLFDPADTAPFKLSRSKVDLYTQCPRCFYLDRRLGVSRPSLPGFTLNIAVDELLKKEFDICRAKKTRHSIMEQNDIKALPYESEHLNDWRNNFRGVQTHHVPTNLLLFGAIDDVWINKNDELMVVDYKATSKRGEINLDEGWGPQYKRQLEFYQWLLAQNEYKVSPTGYFVYCNGNKDVDRFDKKLEFNVEVIAHTGSFSWVEPVLIEIKKLLTGNVPNEGTNCEYCLYRNNAEIALTSQDGANVEGNSSTSTAQGRLL
jgi:CRISPR/Cas system-associated exonuclease Cas4 (RecB family)